MRTQDTPPSEIRTAARGLAFTRLDACALVATLALLAVVTYPALGANRARTDRLVCANHLRQIGKAFLQWGQDHNDSVPFEVRVSDGGTFAHPLAANAWLHFSWISNELGSARVLACPADRASRPAENFTGNPTNGYLHPSFANRATSYFLSHWNVVTPGGFLAGDYNVNRDGYSGCARFLSVADTQSRTVGWTSGAHEQEGNLLFFDGRVEQLNSARFRSLADMNTDNASFHWLLPRQ